jgi:hypothetical protein
MLPAALIALLLPLTVAAPFPEAAVEARESYEVTLILKPVDLVGVERKSDATLPDEATFHALVDNLCGAISHGAPVTNLAMVQKMAVQDEFKHYGMVWEEAGEKTEGGWPAVGKGFKGTVQPGTAVEGATVADRWTFFMADGSPDVTLCTQVFKEIYSSLTTLARPGDGIAVAQADDLHYEIFSPVAENP